MRRQISLIVLILLVSVLNFSAARAVEVPSEIQELMKQEFPSGKFRLDGVFQIGSELLLPIHPEGFYEAELEATACKVDPCDESGESLREAIQKTPPMPVLPIYKNRDLDILFSNGWIFTAIKDRTIKSLDFYDPLIQKQILQNVLPEDFIVPKKFKLPRDLSVIAGHLPIKFRNVELATHKEAKYLELLKKEIADSVLKILSYDQNAGKLQINKISLRKELADLGKAEPLPDGSAKLADKELEVVEINDISKDVSFLSQMKIINDEAYLVDYNQGKVYKLIDMEDELVLEEWLSVDSSMGLVDFTISFDGSMAYLITNKKPQVLIYNALNRELFKTLDIAPNPSSILNFSNDYKESDFMIVSSKSKDELSLINFFDHRFIAEIEVGSKPIAMANGSSELFVANKGDKSISIIDLITRKPRGTILLSSSPRDILVGPDESKLFVLLPEEHRIDVVDLLGKEYEVVASIDLSSDIISPSKLSFSPLKHFIVVGSSGSDLLAIVATDSMELLRKVDIGSKSNHILVFNRDSLKQPDSGIR